MTDNTEYTSESDILDSFVYNLLPIFLFTTNFLDDNWNYTNSIGRRIFDDAIFLGTPFIGTLILLWIKSDDIIWPSILYTIHLSFFIIYFVATRAWLNHVFPCFVAIFYSIVQSLIVYRKEEDEKDKENKKDEDKENIKNEVNMDNMENKEDEEDESKNKKLIETITRFIIWSILHGIIVTELWIFPISIKFGVGFLNFIFIENSNNFKENSHLPVKYFFYLDHMDKDKNKENKDFVHNNRFKNIRSLYLK
ncbi:19007_t:CDS:2 [Rhizophagus irregularis]|nr:19007_t:CDS:2 [Rhizophagus irregularis]